MPEVQKPTHETVHKEVHVTHQKEFIDKQLPSIQVDKLKQTSMSEYETESYFVSDHTSEAALKTLIKLRDLEAIEGLLEESGAIEPKEDLSQRKRGKSRNGEAYKHPYR